MRTRTIFIILLIFVLLIGLGPALLAVGSQEVAEAFGCEVELNRVIPFVIGGKDYGQTFYDHLVFLSEHPGGPCAAWHLGCGRAHRPYRALAQDNRQIC
jgi:hypothetical protein